MEKGGVVTKKIKIDRFKYGTKIVGAMFGSIRGTPSIMTNSTIKIPSSRTLFTELFKSFLGRSANTKEALFLEAFQSQNGLIPEKQMPKWKAEVELLRKELLVNTMTNYSQLNFVNVF